MLKSIIQLITMFSRKIRDDYVAAFSAQAAFFIIISFFPFLMLILSIIKFLPFESSTMLRMFTQIFPMGLNSLIISVTAEIYETTSSGTLISVTALTALWSAGKGVLAIMRGLNSVYEIQETRHYIFLRITSAIYTLVFAIMIIASMVLFVFGNRLYYWIEQKFPKLQNLALLIISLRTIVGFITLLIFFLIIYVAIPNRKTKIINELPGALVCSAGWMGFSYLYSYYIDNFSNYASMYGSLTAIVLFMLWLYFCMYILFIGAEVNLMFENNSFKEKLKKIFNRSNII